MEQSISPPVFQFVQFAAVLLTGLVAGLFYGYDCSVIKGLGNLEADCYLKAFQSINHAIQNPYFFISFIGNLLVLPIASWLSYGYGNKLSFYSILIAMLVYFIGVFGITVYGNVQLNEQLENFKILKATANEISDMRKAFETSWNSYHKIRTVASIVTFSLAIFSLLKQKI